MKTLFTCLLVLAVAGAASAQQTMTYGWEDGGEMLGCYSCEGMAYYNDNSFSLVGSASLAITEVPGNTTTPQAYVAWITGLSEGDQVTASFDVYDDTVGANPSIRIWGHYASDTDINAYSGSAGGNSTYSGAVGGWENLSYTFTIGAGQTALVVEARPYESTSATVTQYLWIDNLVVTAPDGATIHMVDGTVSDEDSSWSGVKALFR
ncbi:MAG: hypothetical protein R6X35_16255 [Candidatus Krumholzibacteriia bacterium]